jgi:hypothetical protein
MHEPRRARVYRHQLVRSLTQTHVLGLTVNQSKESELRPPKPSSTTVSGQSTGLVHYLALTFSTLLSSQVSGAHRTEFLPPQLGATRLTLFGPIHRVKSVSRTFFLLWLPGLSGNSTDFIGLLPASQIAFRAHSCRSRHLRGNQTYVTRSVRVSQAALLDLRHVPARADRRPDPDAAHALAVVVGCTRAGRSICSRIRRVPLPWGQRNITPV